MKMKLTSTFFLFATIVLSLAFHGVVFFLPLVFGAAFGLYGVARSAARHLDPLNDVPNALRVFLASAGGYLLALDHVFIFPAAGILLYAGSLYLNDEYQRMAIHSLHIGRKGGSVALLGIDGSGKSTHAAVSSAWLQNRGYEVTLMPFHTYLFVEKLSSISNSARGNQRRRRKNPFRPVLSLVDNLILQITSSIGSRAEGRVVIYDRFIWSTYIKYEALRYPVKPLSWLYLLPRPFFAIVLDVPVEKSLKVIDQRVAHIRYPATVLQQERQRYLDIARRNGYPVIDATSSFEEVQGKIEGHLSRLFPQVSGVGPI
jgi:dTMP kinase